MRSRTRLSRLVLVSLAVLSTLPAAAATLDLQLFGGGRSGRVDSDAVSGRTTRFDGEEEGVAVLAEPLAGTPVTLGAFAVQQRLASTTPLAEQSLAGFEAGLEALAWLPTGIIQPFVRLGVALVGRQTYTASVDAQRDGVAVADVGTAARRIEESGAVRGYHGAVGLRLTPLGGYSAFFEIEGARESFLPQAGAHLWMTSHAVLLGVDRVL